jgi:hypothetical protein
MGMRLILNRCLPWNIKVGVVIALAATLAALPDAARAKGHAGHASGGHGGSHSGQGHHFGRGAVFVGGALFYPSPYSYGFYPLRDDLQPPGPIIYIEQFTETPTPDTKDWIYCPEKAASYPEVTECPGGWQRVFPQGQAVGH